VARFRVTAVARFPVEQIQFEARPGSRVGWYAGSRTLTRRAQRNLSTDYDFAVRVPSTGLSPLYVRIAASGPGGVVWKRGVGMGLGSNPRAERARTLPDGRGGKVLQFEAAPVSTPADGDDR